MLVLSRKSSEQIVIGEDVVVTVVRIDGNTVRLGIEAPRSVRVRRGELAPLQEQQEFSLEAPVTVGAGRPITDVDALTSPTGLCILSFANE